RAAENLTWLGRYIERSEDTVRVLRAYHVRLAETSDPEMPLLADIRDYLEPFGIEIETAIPLGLIGMLDSAVYSAGQIRDRFSPDGWLALKDLSKTIHKFAGTARTLARLTGNGAPDGALDMMLEIGDSVMTHRRQYPVQAGRRTVIDLLALDPLNPRSILFQLERLRAEIGMLPSVGGEGHMSPAAKEILQLNTAIAVMEPQDMTAKVLDDLANQIGDLYN
ncbi:MAG: hypothetical protein E5V89_32530, partial [Mesorhizobium sp.]